MNESDRPSVTFALFAYNQNKYIQAAVTAALEQSYSPLEIIISDDCSTDNTFEIIENLARNYDGPNTLIITKNSENLGTARHVNKVLEMASGEFIVMAAGDDISKPNRTEFLVNAWLTTGKADCSIFTNAIVINGRSEQCGTFYNNPTPSLNVNDFIKTETCWAGGFSQGFPISLYKKYGPITPETFQEDGAISFRALLNSGIKYFDEVTVLYRRHANNSYDICTYEKLKNLYRSELGLAKGRINDLAKHSELTAVQRKQIQEILNKNVRVKHVFTKYPVLIKCKILLSRLKILVRSPCSQISALKCN